MSAVDELKTHFMFLSGVVPLTVKVVKKVLSVSKMGLVLLISYPPGEIVPV